MTSEALRNVGINTIDARDKQGRHIFLPVGLEMELQSTRKNYPNFWLWELSREGKDGPDCCSRKWVSVHYNTRDELYFLDRMRQWHCLSNPQKWPYWESPETQI